MLEFLGDSGKRPTEYRFKKFTPPQIDVLWPSAKQELLVFASAMEKAQMQITADQIRLAVQLADQKYEETHGKDMGDSNQKGQSTESPKDNDQPGSTG